MKDIEKLCSKWMSDKHKGCLDIVQFSYHPPMGVIGVQHAEVSGSLSLSERGERVQINSFSVEQDSFDVPRDYIAGILKYYMDKGGKFNVQSFNDTGNFVALYCLGPTPYTGISFTFHCKLPEGEKED